MGSRGWNEPETTSMCREIPFWWWLPSGGNWKWGGGYNECHSGTALYLERASMACGQNYQHPFMIIYCIAALILQGAKQGCFNFFLKVAVSVLYPQRAVLHSSVKWHLRSKKKQKTPSLAQLAALMPKVSLRLWFVSKHLKPLNIKHRIWFLIFPLCNLYVKHKKVLSLVRIKSNVWVN